VIAVDRLFGIRCPSRERACIEIDPVEEHRELCGLHLDVIPARIDDRKLASAFLQSLQVEDEAGSIPKQDLHLVLRFADEDEQVPAVGIALQ
jgi:hypothetical protein